jgi:hypothetical protein
MSDAILRTFSDQKDSWWKGGHVIKKPRNYVVIRGFVITRKFVRD